MKNPDMPFNKSICIMIGVIMIATAVAFSYANGFRMVSGHLQLGLIGAAAVGAGLCMREEQLRRVLPWFLILNVVGAIASLIS
jgi:hypothetical protein